VPFSDRVRETRPDRSRDGNAAPSILTLFNNGMNLKDAKIGQILIPVENLERAVSFYRDVLGLSFLFQAPPQMAFFNCGGTRLLVGVAPGQQRGSAIYFQVQDIQGVATELKGKGVGFGQEPHIVHRTPNLEVWLAEFKDPDGNQLALMSEVPTGGG